MSRLLFRLRAKIEILKLLSLWQNTSSYFRVLYKNSTQERFKEL